MDTSEDENIHICRNFLFFFSPMRQKQKKCSAYLSIYEDCQTWYSKRKKDKKGGY
jgi:hypothetical protein